MMNLIKEKEILDVPISGLTSERTTPEGEKPMNAIQKLKFQTQRIRDANAGREVQQNVSSKKVA